MHNSFTYRVEVDDNIRNIHEYIDFDNDEEAFGFVHDYMDDGVTFTITCEKKEK